MAGYVYILASKSGVLYVGVTNSLWDRVLAHRMKLGDGFTKRYNVVRLLHFEMFEGIVPAIAREKQIKGWTREKKIALIESRNPAWKDLADHMPLATDQSSAPQRQVSAHLTRQTKTRAPSS